MMCRLSLLREEVEAAREASISDQLSAQTLQFWMKFWNQFFSVKEQHRLAISQNDVSY